MCYNRAVEGRYVGNRLSGNTRFKWEGDYQVQLYGGLGPGVYGLRRGEFERGICYGIQSASVKGVSDGVSGTSHGRTEIWAW